MPPRQGDAKWVKLTGSASESLLQALSEPAVVVLQEIRGGGGEATAADDALESEEFGTRKVKKETMLIPGGGAQVSGEDTTAEGIPVTGKGVHFGKTCTHITLEKIMLIILNTLQYKEITKCTVSQP